jgi:hypothetical protein
METPSSLMLIKLWPILHQLVPRLQASLNHGVHSIVEALSGVFFYTERQEESKRLYARVVSGPGPGGGRYHSTTLSLTSLYHSLTHSLTYPLDRSIIKSLTQTCPGGCTGRVGSTSVPRAPGEQYHDQPVHVRTEGHEGTQLLPSVDV